MSGQPNQAQRVSALNSSWFWMALLGAPVAIRLALSVVDSEWWGINYLAFAPVSYAIVLAALTVLSLLWALFRPSQSLHTNRIEQVSAFLVTSRGAALTALVGAGLFWVFSSNSHLFASGYERIGNLAQRTTPFAHEYEYLASRMSAALYQITSGLSDRALDDAALVTRIMSVLSGSGCIWLWLAIIGRLSKNYRERAGMLGFLFFGGASTLFFGSGELQAPAVLCVSLLVWLSLALLQSSGKTARLKYSLALALSAAVGPLYLAQLIFFVPAVIFILVKEMFPGAGSKRIWRALLLATLAALTWYVYHLGSENLWVGARLMYPGGKPPEFSYGLFGIARFFDLANSGFFLWPMAPALFWLLVRYSFSERVDQYVSSLGALAGAAALWIVIADFPGGAAREVTTLAPFSIPALVLAGHLWNKRVATSANGQKLTGALLLISVVSFLSIAPVMNSAKWSVSYLDHDYQRRSERYLAGIVGFRDHYFFIKNFTAADRWERNLKGKSEVYLDHETVLGLVRAGQRSAALRRLEFLLTSHPHWAQLWATQAGVYLSLGRHAEALESISLARQLAPESHTYLINEGDIWRALGEPDSARVRYETAYSWVSHNPQALVRMGMLAFESGDYERAKKFAYLLFESDLSNVYSYLIIGLSANETGDIARARAYLSYVSRVAPNIPEAELIREILEKLKSAKT